MMALSSGVIYAVMAVASLLPGTLPLGLGILDPPGFGLKAYRWRKFGFPLKLFRNVSGKGKRQGDELRTTVHSRRGSRD